MVKSEGEQRESDEVVVPLTGGQHNAPVGKASTLITRAARMRLRAWPRQPGYR
jgi:hypothetical protein